MMISVGQALLILIDENIKIAPTSEYVQKLKNLYFLGFKSPEDFVFLEQIKTELLLKNYQISTSPEVINEDATRRYFETHLAFESIKPKIKTFSLDLAKLHYKNIRNAFDGLGGDLDHHEFKRSGRKIVIRDYDAELVERKIKNLNPDDLIKGLSKREQETIDRLFAGHYIESDHETAKEYADLMIQIKNNPDLSDHDKETATTLLKSWRLSMILMRKIKKYQDLGLYLIDNIPGPNLYHQGMYLSDKRGRKRKEDTFQIINTQAFGLMKNYMPLPRGDRALADTSFDYPKPSDMSTYLIEAEWIKYSMALLVHPYSNAISGVMLLQLRIMLKLNLDEKLCLNNKDILQHYLSTMIAILTAYTGGHSLLEFTAPIDLPQLKDYFSFMPEYEQITLKSMFKENNEAAFEQALSKTIFYHNQLLNKTKLHIELKKHFHEKSVPLSSRILQLNKTKVSPLYQYQSAKQPNITILAASNEPSSNKPGLASLKR